MLPHPSSPDFPAALKARRELKGMSRAELARAAGIHLVMPRRYEEPDCGEFARPRPETTWLVLNRVLGFEVPNDVASSPALRDTETFERDSAEAEPQQQQNKEAENEGLLLKNATLEDIIAFLHSKNIEPTFRHLLVSSDDLKRQES